MPTVRPNQPPPAPKGVLCPYCGRISADARRCRSCAGYFDPLSRQATQNSMGPWFIRDDANPFRPGCSYETLRDLIRRGRLTLNSVIRGPATRQYWNFAGRTPSVAHLLGICHNCRTEVNPDDFSCRACGASFSPETDRQHLGLAPVHLLPGQAAPEIVAAASLNPGASVRPPAAAAARAPTPRVPEPPRALPRSRGWIIALAILVVALAGALVALVAVLRMGVDVPWLRAAPVGETAKVPAAGAPGPALSNPEVAHARPAVPERTAAEISAREPVAAPLTVKPAAPASIAGAVLPYLRGPGVNLGTARGTLSELGQDNPGRGAELALWLRTVDRQEELFRLRALP